MREVTCRAQASNGAGKCTRKWLVSKVRQSAAGDWADATEAPSNHAATSSRHRIASRQLHAACQRSGFTGPESFLERKEAERAREKERPSRKADPTRASLPPLL